MREDRGGLLREEEGGIQYIRLGLTWVAYIDWHLHIRVQRA